MEAKAMDNVVDITGDGETVSREELFARQYVQDINPFPELQVRLTKIFGPGPERDMLHQLIYWFGRKKMQNRWTLYKTFEEWRDERGLNRKQVDRARKRLAPTGIVEEKKGPYKRVHFRINWTRLREVLDGARLYPLKGGQSMTVPPQTDDTPHSHAGGTPEQGESVATVPPQTGDTADSHAGGTPEQGGAITTVPPQMDSAPHSHAGGTPEQGESVATVPPQMDDTPLENGAEPSDRGVQFNTGTYAGEYVKRERTRVLSRNSLLQSGENDFSSRPSPPEINKELPQDEEHHEGVNGSRQASFSGKPELDTEVLSEIKDVLTQSHNANIAAEAYSDYCMFGGDTTPIMEAVVSVLGFRCLSEEVRHHVREAIRELAS